MFLLIWRASFNRRSPCPPVRRLHHRCLGLLSTSVVVSLPGQQFRGGAGALSRSRLGAGYNVSPTVQTRHAGRERNHKSFVGANVTNESCCCSWWWWCCMPGRSITRVQRIERLCAVRSSALGRRVRRLGCAAVYMNRFGSALIWQYNVPSSDRPTLPTLPRPAAFSRSSDTFGRRCTVYYYKTALARLVPPARRSG